MCGFEGDVVWKSYSGSTPLEEQDQASLPPHRRVTYPQAHEVTLTSRSTELHTDCYNSRILMIDKSSLRHGSASLIPRLADPPAINGAMGLTGHR